MTKAILQYIFPDMKGIEAEPLPDCPKCKGEGFYKSLIGKMKPCLCVFLTVEDKARRIAVESMQETISALRANPKPMIAAGITFAKMLNALAGKSKKNGSPPPPR